MKTSMFIPQTAKMAVVTCGGQYKDLIRGQVLTVSWDGTITDDDGDFETTLSYHLRKTGVLNALLFLFFCTRLQEVSEGTMGG